MSDWIWTAEVVAELARLRGEGLSFRKIAQALNERFRLSLTRNAVCGKINRMNQAPAAGPAPLRLPACVAPEAPAFVRDPFGGLEPMTCEEIIEGVVCGRPVRRGRVWCAECNARFRISGSARVGRPPSEARVMRAAPKAPRRGDGWERFA